MVNRFSTPMEKLAIRPTFMILHSMTWILNSWPSKYARSVPDNSIVQFYTEPQSHAQVTGFGSYALPSIGLLDIERLTNTLPLPASVIASQLLSLEPLQGLNPPSTSPIQGS